MVTVIVAGLTLRVERYGMIRGALGIFIGRPTENAIVNLDEIVAAGIPESWSCIDCGMNTAPGCPNAAQLLEAFERGQNGTMNFNKDCEVYTVKASVWKTAAKENIGCLCIGCLEQRLGRRLRAKDFNANNELNLLPGTDRLISRRMGMS